MEGDIQDRWASMEMGRAGGQVGELSGQIDRWISREIDRWVGGRWAGGGIVGAGGCNLHPTPSYKQSCRKNPTITEIVSSSSY